MTDSATPPPGKLCTGRCGLVKTLDQFGADGRKPDRHRSRCLDCENADTRDRIAATRTAVFSHYGTACVCCGATEPLEIDHVNGGGTAHRIELFGHSSTSAHFFRWLIREGFPDGFQTMCEPCNASKGDGAACRLWHGDPSKRRCLGPCGEVKDLVQFHAEWRRGRLRRRSRCRECVSAADRTRYAENISRVVTVRETERTPQVL
jgi:hypothetical protein